MSEPISIDCPAVAAPRALKLQAFSSSLLALAGALVAALLLIGVVAVTLPLMLAASLTLRTRGAKRRGWQELELAAA